LRREYVETDPHRPEEKKNSERSVSNRQPQMVESMTGSLRLSSSNHTFPMVHDKLWNGMDALKSSRASHLTTTGCDFSAEHRRAPCIMNFSARLWGGRGFNF